MKINQLISKSLQNEGVFKLYIRMVSQNTYLIQFSCIIRKIRISDTVFGITLDGTGELEIGETK